MIEPRLQPGKDIHRGARESLRTTLGERASGDLDVLHNQLIATKGYEEGSVADGRFAQQLEIAADTFIHRLAAHILEIDRDLRAGDVESEHGLRRTTGPGICRKDVGRGELRGLIRRRRRHAALTSRTGRR